MCPCCQLGGIPLPGRGIIARGRFAGGIRANSCDDCGLEDGRHELSCPTHIDDVIADYLQKSGTIRKDLAPCILSKSEPYQPLGSTRQWHRACEKFRETRKLRMGNKNSGFDSLSKVKRNPNMHHQIRLGFANMMSNCILPAQVHTLGYETTRVKVGSSFVEV